MPFAVVHHAPPPLLRSFVLCGLVLAIGGSLWFTVIGFLDEAIASWHISSSHGSGGSGVPTARAGLAPACFYGGMGVGSAVLGRVADGKSPACVRRRLAGRRPVILLSMFVSTAAAMLASLAPTPVSVLPLVGLLGVGVGGAVPTGSALFADITMDVVRVAKHRGWWMAALGCAFGIGAIPTAFAAYVPLGNSSADSGWRTMLRVFAAAELAALALLALALPESARWRRLQATCKHGDGDGDAPLLEDMVVDHGGGGRARTHRPRIRSVLQPSLCRTTFCLWLIWGGFNFAISGFSAFLPQLLDGPERSKQHPPRGGGVGVFVNSSTSTPRPDFPSRAAWWRQTCDVATYSAAAIPGVLLAATALRRADSCSRLNANKGRRVLLCVSVALTALCTGLLGLVGPGGGQISSTSTAQESTRWQRVALGSVSSLVSNAAWATLYTVTPEAYPTSLRAAGFGYAHSVHSVAGVLGPLAGAFLMSSSSKNSSSDEAALLLFAAALLAAAGAAALLPAAQDFGEDDDDEGGGTAE